MEVFRLIRYLWHLVENKVSLWGLIWTDIMWAIRNEDFRLSQLNLKWCLPTYPGIWGHTKKTKHMRTFVIFYFATDTSSKLPPKPLLQPIAGNLFLKPSFTWPAVNGLWALWNLSPLGEIPYQITTLPKPSGSSVWVKKECYLLCLL